MCNDCMYSYICVSQIAPNFAIIFKFGTFHHVHASAWACFIFILTNLSCVSNCYIILIREYVLNSDIYSLSTIKYNIVMLEIGYVFDF